MPVWDEAEQRFRTTVDDFFTTEFPGGSWPFSSVPHLVFQTPSFGPGSQWWNAVEPSVFEPRMDVGWFSSIFPGSPHVGTNHSNMAKWRVLLDGPTTQEESRNAVVAVANEVFADLGLSFAWDGGAANGSYILNWLMNGYAVEQHHMEMRADAVDPGAVLIPAVWSGQPYSYSGTYGSFADIGGRKPKATWREDVQAVVADRVANHGWRWIKPIQTWPDVRPLSSAVNWGSSGSSLGYAYDTQVDIARPFTRILRHADSDLVPWIKFIDWTDFRTEQQQTIVDGLAVSGYPIVQRLYGYGNYSGWTQYDVQWGHRCAPANQTFAAWITSLDGQTPQTFGEAVEMCGVTVNSWYMGIPGLVRKAENPWAVNWTGQMNGPGFALHGLHWLTGTLFPGVTTIEQLLDNAAVSQSLHCELYPESLVGPIVSTKVPVEKLSLDLSMHGGVRLGAGIALAGGDGGGF